jgi:hypothetical protein
LGGNTITTFRLEFLPCKIYKILSFYEVRKYPPDHLVPKQKRPQYKLNAFYNIARLQVLTAVLLKNQTLWDITLCFLGVKIIHIYEGT